MMTHNLILKNSLYLFLLFSTLTHAETCPTPAALNNNDLQGWTAIDINSGEALHSKQLAEFTKSVVHFALAEWMADAPEGEAHCYYDGKLADQSYLGAYLAKQNLSYEKTNPYWHGNSAWNKQCQSALNECLFVLDRN